MKRFDMCYSVSDGAWIEEAEDGEYVQHDDHVAIVDALEFAVIRAIVEEPELPGDPPEVLMDSIKAAVKSGDDRYIVNLLRAVVSTTKECSLKRATEYMKRVKEEA